MTLEDIKDILFTQEKQTTTTTTHLTRNNKQVIILTYGSCQSYNGFYVLWFEQSSNETMCYLLTIGTYFTTTSDILREFSPIRSIILVLDSELLQIVLEVASKELILLSGVIFEVVGTTPRSLKELKTDFEMVHLIGFDHSNGEILKTYIKQMEEKGDLYQQR